MFTKYPLYLFLTIFVAKQLVLRLWMKDSQDSRVLNPAESYSPLSLTQSWGDQANHFKLSVLWANQIMTS